VRAQREYLLSDGKRVTAQEVAKKAGIGITTARTRLRRTDDPIIVFKHPASKCRFKTYTLDDGTTMSVPELIKKTGMTRAQARYRLSEHTDPEKIFLGVTTVSQAEQPDRERMYLTKPINDKYHRMFMMMA